MTHALTHTLVQSLDSQSLLTHAQLLLNSSYFLLQFTLVKSLLSHDLTAQILQLASQAFLDRVIFLSHDFPPDSVHLVEDFRDGNRSDLVHHSD